MKVLRFTVLAVIIALMAGFGTAEAAQGHGQGWDKPLMPMFEKAAANHDVPLPLLLTLAYFGSAFENRGDAPTIEGGYGVMALRDNNFWKSDTLGEGANLTKVPRGQLKTDAFGNINAAAAVLSAYANQMGIDRSKGLDQWLRPVIKYAGLDEEYSRMFAMEVYEKLLTGLDWTNSSGERFQFSPQDIGDIDLSDLQPKSARPVNLNQSEQAAQGAFPHSRPTLGDISANLVGYSAATWYPAASCNYSTAQYNKTTAVIHTIEGTAAGCLSWFRNCDAEVSAHYVVSEAGGVWQCVDEIYTAWHVGCANSYCIGDENEGYAASSSHPTSLYNAAGLLFRDICNRWGIPKEHRSCPPGILGHLDINNCVCGGTHWDPGSGWDWNYFIGVVQGTPPPPSYDATYHAASYPSHITAGTTAVVWAEFTNQGTAVWSHAATRLGTSSPQDRSSVFYTAGNWIGPNRPTEVDQSAVSQGQVGRFTFIITAPSTPGTYVEKFRLVEEGVTWFGPEISWTMVVDPATGGISGNVKSSGGANLSGATVAITGGSSTTTDTNGNYSFTGLSPGTYTLTASKAGYISANAPVSVVAGSTTTQNFTLTPTDTQAPTVPTNLTAVPVMPTQINLAWTPSTDNVGVAGYKVYRNGTQIGTSATTSYADAGLSPNTSYSYQVAAYDAIGNTSALCTAVNASTPPSEYILDNGVCELSGVWATATSSTDKYGADYLYASTATSTTKTATWRPNLIAGGTYDVYCWYCVGSNRATNAPYTIYWSGGSQTVNVNQQVNGGQWVLLASDKTFAAGTTGYVQLGNGTGATGKIVIADAVRFVMKTVDAIAPSVPASLAGSAASMTQIDLSWSASSDNVSVAGYKVYRDNVLIGSTANLTYSDTGCTPGTTYGYQVSAYDGAGNESAKCTAVQVTSLADSVPPSTPTNLAGTAVSTTQIDLTWTASTDNVGVTGYRIYRDGVQIATSATNAYSDTDCAFGTTYTYQVAAYDAVGNLSGNSNAIEVTTLGNDTEAPSVPTSLAATPVSGSEIDLAWAASTDNVGVTGYKVYRDGVQIATTTLTSYVDATCSEVTTYAYEVSAYDAAENESTKCSPVSATTLDVTAPTVPAGLAATAVSGTQVDLTWTASTDNVGVTLYKVFRNGTQIGTSATASYSDANCSPGVTYTYAVSACDAAENESARSATASATTPDTVPPTAPTGLAATVVSQTQVNLAWNASTDNVGVAGYKVYRNGAFLTSVAGTSYSDMSCDSYTQYTYQVTAYDAASNESAGSNTQVVTTPAFTDIVKDNPSATFVGSWFTGTASPDKYGADYNYCTTATSETKSATWTPKIDIPGYYTVYVWYPQGSNRSTMAPFTITWNGGQQTVNVNQQVNGGQWVTLVTNKRFAAGTSGSVKLGNGTGELSLNVMADAVRFLLVSDDLTPPSVPSNLAANAVSATQINLTWTASTDNVGVAGYKIFRNGAQVGTSATNSFSDTGLTQYTAYTYTVSAYDAMGNESAQSSQAGATTWDGQAPTVPTGLSATAVGPQRVNLSWNASTDNVGVTGYKVYRNGAYVASTTTTSYSNGGLAPGTAYTFTVTAYDARNNESAQSSGAGATTPAYAQIIIDNPAATFTGVWTIATSSTDKYGTDYAYASTALTEGKTAIWRPTIQYAGNYDVYIWYPQGSNRATNSPFTVYWDGGSQTVNWNQQTNGGAWRLLLGNKHFATGTAGYVKLGNGTGTTGQIVVADAVRFVQISGD